MPFEPYLNVEEIESAMETAAINNPGLCQLITLPNLTYEGRTTHAVRISGGTLADRTGVLLLGGVHAREWGSSDILIAFMENIIEAYNNGTGLSYQGKTYSSAEVQQIVENVDIFIFPDANPDGKAFSQGGTDWRKNRRPLNGEIGVDVNRNYDFLWDANVYFDPSLYFGYLYTPSSGTYHGPSPFSEAESQNIKWLIDTYPNIAFFVDIHSYGQKIMYVWGNDENQSTYSEHNFSNSAFNGQRGVPGDVYSEFIFDTDAQKIVNAANRMNNALFSVRGKSYSTGQIFHQVGVSAGASASYVFSRHFSNSSQRKVFAFGIEWGQAFQPPPVEMTNIIDDIDAALTEMCLCASEPNIFIRDSLGDTGKEPSTGSISASPDIIVRKLPVASPEVDLGDITVDPGSDKVEIGNDNYLYVRVHNQGGMPSDAAVRLYYAPLTTSCSPALWHFIDEVDITNIPAEGYKVSGAVTWPHVPDPGTSHHFCLIAVCGSTVDSFPDTTMIDSASDFIQFMRNSNNIAYRNVTFEDVLPDGWAEIPFVVTGFPGKRERYNLVLDGSKLPEDSRVELKTERRILKTKDTKLENIKTPAPREKTKEIFLKIGKGNLGTIRNLRIAPRTTPQLVIRIHLPKNAKPAKEYPFLIVQQLGRKTLGQITVLLRCVTGKKKPHHVKRRTVSLSKKKT
ncbi:MAG: hypothetical protein JXB26_00660 [Candidatus Aminicenantes bacterium]|nr:hypothetical protein [Candidatus Aminicenantes bacterium]